MANKRNTATVGAVEHGNSFVLVTVAHDGNVLDRRHVDLTGPELPTHPYHHQGSWAVGRYKDSPWAKDISLADAVRLVEKVEAAAAKGARQALADLQDVVAAPINSIAIRACPAMPPTIEARIMDNRAQTYADTVMYRLALAAAAEAKGWRVIWYDRDEVMARAARALGVKDAAKILAQIGKTLGPPWQAKQKLAAAAAIASR